MVYFFAKIAKTVKTAKKRTSGVGCVLEVSRARKAFFTFTVVMPGELFLKILQPLHKKKNSSWKT